jgi:hypothetical protein
MKSRHKNSPAMVTCVPDYSDGRGLHNEAVYVTINFFNVMGIIRI